MNSKDHLLEAAKALRSAGRELELMGLCGEARDAYDAGERAATAAGVKDWQREEPQEDTQ